MCEKPLHAFLCKEPKSIFGNFMILTRQYREYAQLGKEYLFFSDKYLKRFNYVQDVWLPCGKCIQCKYKRSKDWEIRSIFEKNSHIDNCCVTLTYDDENLPHCNNNFVYDDVHYTMSYEKSGIACYKDVQDFIKRIRKHFKFKKEIRYICSVEYGTNGTLRPHFHLILFGFCPNDLKLYKKSKKGTLLYKSAFLNSKWNKGFVDVGKCDIQSCRYVSQYCVKGLLKEKRTMSLFDKIILQYKNSISRECIHASLGLGLNSFIKNYLNIIHSECIRYGKFVYGIPRYFIKKLESINNILFTKVKEKRHLFWLNFVFDDEVKRNAINKTYDILQKLDYFSGDILHCKI